MVAQISIEPAAAETAGCSATATLVDSGDDFAGDNLESWWKHWRFDALAAQGWVFDHWDMAFDYQDVEPSGASGSYTDDCSDNPWQSLPSAEAQYGNTGEWRSDVFHQFDPSRYRVTWRIITGMTAVFRLSRVPTHLILRSATSGQIIRGATGAILTDD